MTVAAPKISIIVPVFNTQEYLPECLESLLSQTIENAEIICVDNGSTDSSLQILEGFAGKYENIVVVSHPEGRQGDARNAGLKIAQGQYIGFVDSDDFVDPNMFEQLCDAVISADADMAIGDLHFFEQDEGESVPALREDLLGLRDVSTIAQCPVLFRNLTICNKIFRRKFLYDRRLRFPQGLWQEDQLFVIEAFVQAKGICCVPEAMYYYRKGREGAVGAHSGDRNLEIFEVMELVIQLLERHRLTATLSEIVHEVTACRILQLARLCRGRTRRLYYKKMRAFLQRLRIPEVPNLLTRSELREFRIVRARIGFTVYSVFLVVRQMYGSLRRLGRGSQGGKS